MEPKYIDALETRLRWLQYATDELPAIIRLDELQGFDKTKTVRAMLPAYRHTLEHGPTYFMDEHFCDLVDHARTLTPDTLTFQAEWLQSKEGFLLLERPFYVPPIVAAYTEYLLTGKEDYLTANTHMAAVGWRPLEPGLRIQDNARVDADIGCGTVISKPGDVQFLLFRADENGRVFYTWSFFILRDGQLLGTRVAEFESLNRAAGDGDNYVRRKEDTTLHPLHEIRWIYTAFYMMAQRLASRVRHVTDRGTRRRAEKRKQVAPPFIEVVTLRRKQQAKEEHEIQHRDVEWNWQWHVRGHWRDQWYPAEGIHKPKFIEAYMKGPAEKPVKPPTVKLFAAVR